jgi:hypothetical protein
VLSGTGWTKDWADTWRIINVFSGDWSDTWRITNAWQKSYADTWRILAAWFGQWADAWRIYGAWQKSYSSTWTILSDIIPPPLPADVVARLEEYAAADISGESVLSRIP